MSRPLEKVITIQKIISKKMGKFNFISWVFILTVLLSGCVRSADVDESLPVQDEDAWIQDVSLPVPIEFVLPSTKAVIDELSDLRDNSSLFGLFAVDKDTDDLTKDNGLDIFNRSCTYAAGDPAGLYFGYKGENRKLYYPLNSSVNYSFYAYYTRVSELVQLDNGEITYYDGDDIQAVSQATSSKTAIYAAMPLGTQNDILYGKAEATPMPDMGLDGFNGNYIRKTQLLPTFSFSHPAAGIGLRAAYDGESSAMTEYQQLHFSAVRMIDIPTKAALCIVDLADSTAQEGQKKAGTFAYELARGNKNWIKGNTANLNVPLVVDKDGVYGDGAPPVTYTDPASVGAEHFIMPQRGELKLEVDIAYRQYYKNSNGDIVTADYEKVTVPVSLDPAPFVEGTGAGFEAGKMYRYLLKVKYDSSKSTWEEKISVIAIPDLG